MISSRFSVFSSARMPALAVLVGIRGHYPPSAAGNAPPAVALVARRADVGSLDRGDAEAAEGCPRTVARDAGGAVGGQVRRRDQGHRLLGRVGGARRADVHVAEVAVRLVAR